jgi:hypothetical protein
MLLSTRQGRVLAPLSITALLAVLAIWAVFPALGVSAVNDGSPLSSMSVPQSPPLTWLPSRTDGFAGTALAVHALNEYRGRLYAGLGASMTASALIWSYDAAGGWVPSAEAGFGGANSAVHSLAVYDGILYAGTSNPLGGQVWSSGGEGWSHAADTGFGEAANLGIRSLAVFNGRLYAGTQNATGAHIWSYDGQHWTPVVTGGLQTAANNAVLALIVHANRLYAGTQNANGAQIWTSGDGTHWTEFSTVGWGSEQVTAVTALASYQNELYAAVAKGPDQGAAIWRYDGVAWRQEAADGFAGPSNPLDVNNTAITALGAHEGYLYAATANDVYGAQIWFSDGVNWWPSTKTGLGQGENNRAAPAVVSYAGALWVGIENSVDGASVWFASPQLGFSVISEPEFVVPPNRIRYETVITNTLGIALTGLQAFDTWESMGDCVYEAMGRTHLRWDVGVLGPGESASYKFTLDTHSWCQPQVVTNTVRLQGDNLAPMFTFARTLITEGPPPTPSPTLAPIGPFTVTLQQGLEGYTGTEDTYLSQANPSQHFDQETRIRVGDARRLNGLLRFDLSAIPSGADIAEATLRLYGFDSRFGRDIAVSLHVISRTVTVSEATWSQSRQSETWAIAGCGDVRTDRRAAPEHTFTTAGLRRWYDIDVSSAVQQWVSGDVGNNGWLLLGPEGDEEVHAFAPAEYPTANLRPMLLVTYFTAPRPTSTPTSPQMPTFTATPTHTETPVETATVSPTATSTLAPTGTATVTQTLAPTVSATVTATGTATATPPVLPFRVYLPLLQQAERIR